MTCLAPAPGPAPRGPGPAPTPSPAAAALGAGAAMAEAVERTDELVREYLLFRGFTHTLRQLDAEIKADKEKGFRVRDWRARRGQRRPRGRPERLPHPSTALRGGSGAVTAPGDCRYQRVWPSPDTGGTEVLRENATCLKLLSESGASLRLEPRCPDSWSRSQSSAPASQQVLACWPGWR